MRRIICFFTMLFILITGLSAVTVKEYTVLPSFPTKKITSICYSQNFGFSFSKSETDIIYSGAGRVDFQDYFLDFNIGIANLLEYGGLYGKTFINNETGKSTSLSMKDMNASQEFSYGVGVAIDVPLIDILSLNFEAGPSFGFCFSVDKNDQMNGNFLLGLWTTASARIFPEKDYNLICGIDVGYNVLSVSLDTKTEQTSFGCNYLNLRPFVGFSIKTDFWFKTLMEN